MDKPSQDSALLHAILEAAVDAIIVADRSGKILRTNPATCRMFGYETRELEGQSVNLLMPDVVAAAHDTYLSHHIETGEKKIIGTGRDVEGRRKDQTVFPLHLSVGNTEVDGQPMFIGILHDLTARNQTQDALARSQRLDAIGQMTGGIAHDFNNILTVIIGNLELLEMRGANAAQMSLITDALESAELGADLTSRLMVFARKSNLKPVHADIRVLCEDTLAILKRTLGSNYRIRTDFAETVDPVMIDPVQLQSALMNLALNARDAMGDRGELLVSIANVTIDDTYMAQETDMEPGHYVRLAISDDGCGMNDEAQKRAFEPFFTTKQDSGGTGLGLAMVYGFVRQSGGHITLYSELGHGTSFGLYFPALRTSNAGEERTSPTSQAANEGRIGHGQTVLVVEDNPRVRALSVARVRDLGFRTLEAENADAAFEMLKQGVHVDVLFSDLIMPGKLNGYDLAAKAGASHPNLKILLTSGYASDVVTDAMSNGQSYDILHKPYRQADLTLRLQALLADPPGD